MFADENKSITLQPLREKQKGHVANITNKIMVLHLYARKHIYFTTPLPKSKTCGVDLQGETPENF